MPGGRHLGPAVAARLHALCERRPRTAAGLPVGRPAAAPQSSLRHSPHRSVELCEQVRHRLIHQLTWGGCMPFDLVGVAGFEPAASSSRIRPWKATDLWTLPKMQVRALVCVGLERCSEVAISRSSPGFLQRPIDPRRSCRMADWPPAVPRQGPRSDTGQHDRPPIPGQQISICHDPDAAVGVTVDILHGRP